jgi:hypothetical protein
MEPSAVGFSTGIEFDNDRMRFDTDGRLSTSGLAQEHHHFK